MARMNNGGAYARKDSIRFVTVLCTARLEQIKQATVVRGTEMVHGVRSYWMQPMGDVGRRQAGIEDLMH